MIPPPHHTVPTIKNVPEIAVSTVVNTAVLRTEASLLEMTIASETTAMVPSSVVTEEFQESIPYKLRHEVELPHEIERSLAAPAVAIELLGESPSIILTPITTEVDSVEIYEGIDVEATDTANFISYQYEDVAPDEDESVDSVLSDLADESDVTIMEETIPTVLIETVVDQSEVQISPEISQDYIDRSVELTHVSKLINTAVVITTEAINTLYEAGYEMPVLPAVCLEVSAAIEQLDPEPANKANELVGKITDTIAAVILNREEGDENTHEYEEKLQDLCIELFEYLGIEYNEETVMDFVMGIVQAQKAAIEIAAILNEKEEEGTHETKQDDVQNLSQLARIINFPFTRTLGTLILQLSRVSAA